MEEDGRRGAPDDAGDRRGGPRPAAERLEFLLRGATTVDQVVRVAISHLAELPGVTRVGLGLTEGAGRRLRYVASDHAAEPELPWCHIDAYDDVPLTTVARTGERVVGGLDDLAGHYTGMVEHQRSLGTRALATLPMIAGSANLGGLILFYGEDQAFGRAQLRALETAARRTAEAVRRVRTSLESNPPGPAPAPAGSREAALDLDADPTASGAARRFLRDRLTEWGVDEEIVDSAQLCVSELVNNVIMHARTSSRLTISLEDDRLSVMLRDLGGALPPGTTTAHRPVDDADELRVFGRGLTLVDALADEWASERDEIGTTAWYAFRLDGQERAG